jgi:tubulin polyglutamylase TTLL1
VRLLALILVIYASIILNKVVEKQHEDFQKDMVTIYPYIQNTVIYNTNYTSFKTKYNESQLSIVDSPEYCKESDVMKLLHPDLILYDKYIIRDLDSNNLQREIIKAKFFDAL